jgi:HSP20 family protein
MDIKSLIPFGRTHLGRALGDDPFALMRRDMERLFDGFARDWPMASAVTSAGFLSPKVDIAETDKALEVTADLPGIAEKDIEVTLADGVLTLKAEHNTEHEEKDEKKKYHLIERSSGTFLRSFALPFAADENAVNATFNKGVLKITVPKAASAAKATTKIEVKSAA